MEALGEMFINDPGLKEKKEALEKQDQQWIKENGRLKNVTEYNPAEQKISALKKGSNPTSLSHCGYDNVLAKTIAAPTNLNQIVSPSPNCVKGGEFVTVTGLVKGNVYRISTCGANIFDTQMSLYTAGGAQLVGYNDDWCGQQSEITFNPLTSGNYDILIDEYGCLSNSLCAELVVELIYTPRPVITIPVVVHVVHYGEAIGTGRNISDLQIQSQIDVMNEDFRRKNADISSVPGAFRGISDDALIEFCLASEDESGNPTTGIDRVLGGQASYTNSSMNSLVKPNTIWDRDSYLNIWICNMNSSVTTFPGGAANIDGVVVHYTWFGRVENVATPFNLGRTAVHEVGHWLNLYHIWGDQSGCTTDDFVTDTPVQDFYTSFGTCPAFPKYDGCTSDYPGVMFYNQMDYSGDACLTMFTYGQTARMEATLFGARASLQNSQGCGNTTGLSEKNILSDVSVFPSPSNGTFNIKTKTKEYSLTVINVLGEEVYSENISSKASTITLDLPNGVYFLLLKSGNKLSSQKIIVQR